MKLADRNQMTYLEVQRTPEWYEGFKDLRKKSHPESKLGIPKLLNQPDLQILEVTKLAEKLKWTSYFKRAYSGNTKPLSLDSYSPSHSRMFLAKSGNKEYGFMRITNHSWVTGKNSADDFWCISEVYVKASYRKEKIATRLMEYAINHKFAKCIFIETERYEIKKKYFNSLGLTNCMEFNDTLSYVYIEGYLESLYEKFMDNLKTSDIKNTFSK